MNNNLKDNKDGFFKLKLSKTMKLSLLIALVIIIIISIYYFNKTKPAYFKNVFTSYTPLNDSSAYNQQKIEDNLAIDTSMSIAESNGKEMFLNDSIDNSIDTLNQNIKNFEKEEGITDVNKINDHSNEENTTTNENIFRVNTEYKKLDLPKTLKPSVSNETNRNKQSDMFVELLISDDSVVEKLSTIFSNKPISYEAILKIVSITGQNILLNKEIQTSELIIESLVESENISDIHIIDREGNLAHTTNMPKVNTSIWKFLSDFKMTDIKVSLTVLDGQSQIAIPLFHTYGKIGVAIISVN